VGAPTRRATVTEVADVPSWRQGYDSIERRIGPQLESVLRSDTFAVAVGLAARVQRQVQGEAGRVTRRVLHQLNLPAGTDVTRILNELGQLRRQVRELSDELEETKAALTAARQGPRRRVSAGRQPAARKRASRGGTDAAHARS
jgi:hypothetical protein